MSQYLMITIRGELTLASDLHIGSGDYEIDPQSAAGNTNQIQLDAAGQPFIPASTLRGGIRANLRRFGIDDNELMGSNERPSRLRVDHATLVRSPTDACRLQHHVSINPVTGTANQHHLYVDRLVRAGSQFGVSLKLVRPKDGDLRDLLKALSGWDGSSTSAIGGGKSCGLGEVKWEITELRGLPASELADWWQKEQPLEKANWQNLPIEAPSTATVADTGATLRYQLQFDGPVLVIDPEAPEKCDHDNCLQAYRDSNERFAIPGSSIKGMVRARVRRIINTLFDRGAQLDKNNRFDPDRDPPLLLQIFGAKDRVGLLRFSDASTDQAAELFTQTFVAIDRFTGGAADGALYSAEGLQSPTMSGTVTFDLARLKRLEESEPQQAGAIRALLLGVLRDAMEGQLQLGWGKSRGYGQFRLRIMMDDGELSSWQALLSWLASHQHADAGSDSYDVESWAIALMETIEEQKSGGDHGR